MLKVKPWSSIEDGFLRQCVNSMSREELAKSLGRTKSSVGHRMNKLRIITDDYKSRRCLRGVPCDEKEVQVAIEVEKKSVKKINTVDRKLTIDQVVKLASQNNMSYGQYVSECLI